MQPTPVFLPGESQGREPGGLPSMGSHRVGHNWHDLAAAAEEYRMRFGSREGFLGERSSQGVSKDENEFWVAKDKYNRRHRKVFVLWPYVYICIIYQEKMGKSMKCTWRSSQKWIPRYKENEDKVRRAVWVLVRYLGFILMMQGVWRVNWLRQGCWETMFMVLCKPRVPSEGLVPNLCVCVCVCVCVSFWFVKIPGPVI